MTWFDRHPGRRILGRYADGGLDLRERESIRVHLIGCDRCTEQLTYISELRAAAADLPQPRPPAGLFDKIQDRRGAGDRVILPATAADSGSRRRASALRPVAATLLILVVGIAALAIFAPTATAGRSELVFSPTFPAPGQLLEIEYRPALELTGEEQLRLRLRWRTAADEPPRQGPLGRPLEVPLVRAADGVFTGSVEMPRRAVLVTASVETMSGEIVDSRSGRLWQALIQGTDGRPALSALVQSFRVLEPRSGLAAMEAAREITRLYPESAAGWSLSLGAELRALDERELAERLVFHRGKFLELYRELSSRDATAAQLDLLGSYARRLGEDEARIRIERDLEARFPGDPAAVRNRVIAYAEALAEKAPDEFQQAMESEWAAYGPVSEFLLQQGVASGVATGRPDWIRNWAGRYAEWGRDPKSLLGALEGIPGTAELRIPLAEKELERLLRSVEDDRRLVETMRAGIARNTERERSVRAALGRAFLDDGQTSRALEEFELAVAAGWSPELYGQIADALIHTGDLTRAVQYLAYIAVDPLTPVDSVATLRARIDGIEPAEATVLIQASADEFLRRMSDLPIPGGRVPPGFLLGRSGESDVSFDGLLRQQPGLLVFWERGGPSAAVTERLNDLSADPDLPLVIVTTEAPNPELDGFVSEHVRFTLYHDGGAELAEQLGVFGTPLFLVLDSAGSLTFATDTLDDALRRLNALQKETAAVS